MTLEKLHDGWLRRRYLYQRARCHIVVLSKCSEAGDIKSKKQCANGCGCTDV